MEEQGIGNWTNDRVLNWYQTNVQSFRDQVGQSIAFIGLAERLRRVNAEFKEKNFVRLLDNEDLPQLEVKSFESLTSKVYRLSIPQNRKYPLAPHGAWITTNNLFDRINDCIRTQVVCAYADGALALAQNIAEGLIAAGIRAEVVPEGREEGYHAIHLYAQFPVTVLSMDFAQQPSTITVEIQFRTKLQAVLYELTHLLYEGKRENKIERDSAWKWKIDAPRYMATYLGHTLHLIEGVLVQVRKMVAAERGAASASIAEPTAAILPAPDAPAADQQNDAGRNG